MIGRALVGLVLALVSSRLLYVVLSPARAIWRGDSSRVPNIPRVPPSPRTYLLYLLWFVPTMAATALIGVALMLSVFGDGLVVKVVARVAVNLMFSGLPFTLLHLFACVFNRPHLLITPAYRHEHGWAGAIWRLVRRRNRRPPAVPERSSVAAVSRAGRMPVQVSFEVVLRGYDPAQVDITVLAVTDALQSRDPEVRSAVYQDLHRLTFRRSLRGFDGDQVETYLREAVARLAPSAE
jgi:hypothetical protein